MSKPRGELRSAAGAEIVDGLKELVEHLECGGMETEKFTVRSVPRLPPPRQYSSDDVKALRTTLRMSEPVFAQFVGVDVKTLLAWESGRSKPNAVARRLMEEYQRRLAEDPEFGPRRIEECMAAADD